MFNEYDIVTTIRPLNNIPLGSRGTVLIVYEESDEYEVEFVDENGDSMNVVTVSGVDIKKAE